MKKSIIIEIKLRWWKLVYTEMLSKKNELGIRWARLKIRRLNNK